MKFVIVFAALFAVAFAAPPQSGKDSVIVRSDSSVLPDGFKWAYETSDGKSASEEGQLTKVGTDDEAISVRGQFQYVGDDGVTYQVSYVADENGFQPIGAHLPVAPQA